LKFNNSQSVKEPTKQDATNHGRKLIWKHKRHIQCQKIYWSHWEGFALLYLNISTASLPLKFLCA